jgi:maspardin
MTLHDPIRIHQHYASVDLKQRRSLLDFRTHYVPVDWEYNGVTWSYASHGAGDSTALFLPGAIGTYLIWWQQLIRLPEDFRWVSISYPPLYTLEGLRQGLNALLDREGVDTFHIIGSSMGGYLAQYLASTQPDRLQSAVFANTFAPTKPFLRAAPVLRLSFQILPISLIYAIFRRYTRRRLVPSGSPNPLLEAYLMEFSYAGLPRRHMLARLSCSSQTFTPIQVVDQTFPILIIESENDPLIRPAMRLAVCDLYPAAHRHTFDSAGHFSYLDQPETYSAVLNSFLLSS